MKCYYNIYAYSYFIMKRKCNYDKMTDNVIRYVY